MADVVDKAKRSEIMRAIKGRDTKPELIVRRFLFAQGFRYRIHDKSLPGKPDLKLPKYNCLILVNGCFWHGHDNCSIYRMPKTNKKFWNTKIENNRKRDKKNLRLLNKLGWKTIIVWECQLKAREIEKTMKRVVNKILKT